LRADGLGEIVGGRLMTVEAVVNSIDQAKSPAGN